jgi:hypothetical protein
MAITGKEWKSIEAELKPKYTGSVFFECNGVEVSVVKMMIKENTLALVILVSDENKVTSFYRKTEKSLHTKKEQNRVVAVVGKKVAQTKLNVFSKDIDFSPIFKTFYTFKSQYRKIENLKLVSIGYKNQGELK